jgi:hypothetical protein
MLVLIELQIFGVEALDDDTDKGLGVWLRDGGLACKCHSRVQTGYGFQPHSSRSGSVTEGTTVLLGTVDVAKMKIINLMIEECRFM